MSKSKRTNEKINLIGIYRVKRRSNRHIYKAEYNRMFPIKISSSNFLSLYTLFLLNKHSEPLYGKEMLNKIQEISNSHVWNPSHGTYYPLLEKMEADDSFPWVVIYLIFLKFCCSIMLQIAISILIK